MMDTSTGGYVLEDPQISQIKTSSQLIIQLFSSTSTEPLDDHKSEMATCFKYVRKFLMEIVYIILSVIATLLFPPILLTLVPVFIIRWCIAQYAKHFKHDLGKMLSARASIFAVDPICEKYAITLFTLLTFEGEVTIEEFKDTFSRTILNKKIKKDGDGDELLYPELQQYITQWMGFYFWKPESNFNLDDHIIVLPKEPVFNEDMMLEYITKIVESPFIRNQSPWEIHAIQNCKRRGQEEGPNLTCAVVRCHHALADGFSIVNMMANLSDLEFELPKPAPQIRVRTSAWKSCLRAFTLPLRIPYEGIKVCMESYDFNDWKLPADKLTRKLVAAVHPQTPLPRFKDIKNHYGVSLTSVLLEIFAGTLRNFMLQSNVKVPDKLHCLAPLPLPDHPDKLRIYLTGCFIELPVGTADPIKRLYKIDKHLKKLKQSTFPLTASIALQLGGSLFAPMTKLVSKSVIGTAIVTIFPGPDRVVKYFNRPMRDLYFGGGLLRGRLSLGMTAISYNGMLSLLIGMDKAICSDMEKTKIVEELMMKEIELLESIMATGAGLKEV